MIKVICSGKLKEQYLIKLVEDYLNRIKKYHKIELIEIKDQNDLEKEKENILKYRWGLKDGKIHSVDEVCAKYSVSLDYYCELEDLLLRQVGLIIKNRNDIKINSDRNIDNETIQKAVLSKLCNSNIIK